MDEASETLFRQLAKSLIEEENPKRRVLLLLMAAAAEALRDGASQEHFLTASSIAWRKVLQELDEKAEDFGLKAAPP